MRPEVGILTTHGFWKSRGGSRPVAAGKGAQLPTVSNRIEEGGAEIVVGDGVVEHSVPLGSLQKREDEFGRLVDQVLTPGSCRDAEWQDVCFGEPIIIAHLDVDEHRVLGEGLGLG